MTVPTTISKAGPYAGAGTVGPFPIPFRFLESSHLRVVATDPSGANSTLVLDTDYTVTGAGADSGSVRLTAPLFAGWRLVVLRNVPATQEADYVQNDAFPAESHEQALDKLTMLVQQQGEALGRALVMPESDFLVDGTLPPVSVRAKRYLSFDDFGRPVATTFDIQEIQRLSLEAIESAKSAKESELISIESALSAEFNAAFVREQVAGATPSVVRFSGDGAQVSFDLGVLPGDENNTDVFISGVYQQKDTYNVDGRNLVFDAAPPVGARNIEVKIAPAYAIMLGSAVNISITDDGAIRSLDSYVKETRADVDALDVRADELEKSTVRVPNYAALRAYAGPASIVDVTSAGIAGVFEHITASVVSEDGGVVIVGADGRRWKRLYTAGSVHVDWFGANAAPGSDSANVTAILAAHNYCAGQARDKKVMFGAGSYPFNATLPLRGIVEWEGPAPGGVGATLEWTGSAAVALSLDPQDWYGNYQGTFKKIRIARNAAASRAIAFDLIRCSEYEFQDVYVSDMGTAFRLRGAPINYFDRIVTADCDVVFEYQSGAGLFGNAMHVITRCNFWETHDSVFKFTSGVVYSLFFHDNWVERFGTFIKDGQGDAFPFSMKDFRVRDCHILSVDSQDTRLIWYKAKPGNIESSITRVSFQNTIVALNSSDHICLIDNNGNTAAGTNMFSELSFHDVHAYGAPTALVSSNKFGTTVRVTGDTLAQQGYYYGSVLIQAHNQARPYETNKPQYFTVAWTGDGSTQPSIGNGAIDSNYTVSSGKVSVKVSIDFGSTTVPGNGIWKFSTPWSGLGSIVGTAFLQIPSVANHACTVTGSAANGFVSLALNTNGNLVPFGVTTNATTSLTFEYSYGVV